jgi:Mce-associated membrane protein
MSDAGKPPQDSAKARADALALAEEAEAEAAEAEALAAAARARARALKLRREAEAQAAAEADETTTEATDDVDDTTAAPEPTEATEEVDSEDAADSAEALEEAETTESAEPAAEAEPADDAEPAPESTHWARRWLTVSSVLTAAAIVAICALLGTSGWMLWRHHEIVQERQRSAAFIATARQGVINLTSLDFHKSKEDVQRILDSGTGEFRDQFQKTAEDFASVVKDTKAVAEGSVSAAAVESMTKDSAVVLVLANEHVTNSAGAKDQPRTFRFRVSVVREGDQLKLSKVEFVL